ncbi:MAG: drug/metabolite exporter YedA [Rivihabitans pingtungensis]
MFVAVPAARWRLLAAFAALYVIWGSTYLAIRIGVASWPPLMMAAVRFLLAGGLLYAWQRGRGSAPAAAMAARGRDWRLVAGWRQWRVTVAEQRGGSGVAALAAATVPLFTLACAQMFNSAPRRASGLARSGLAGMLLLNLGANLQAGPLGAALLLLASASWAFGSVWGKRLDLPAGPMAAATEMLVGGVVLALARALAGERPQAGPTLEGWLALAYLVVFGSLVAFSAYLYLLKTVRPALATSYAYVNPVVAVGLGVAFAGERIGSAEWLAMAVIVLAVVWISLPRRAA